MLSKQRTLEILDKSSNGDRIGIYCDRFLSTLILLNLLAVSLESIAVLGQRFETQFLWFELFSVTIFGVEYLLRIWASSAREDSRFQSATGRRLGYIFSFTGIIDLVAILPSLLPLLLSGGTLFTMQDPLIQQFFRGGLGQLVIIAVIGMMVVGYQVMKRMVEGVA